MKKLQRILQDLFQEEDGQDLIEYALVAALIGLGAVSTLKGIANTITNTFASISNTLAAST